MPYTIKHEPVLDVIEVTLTGVLAAGGDVTEMTSDAVRLQKQTGVTRFLLDAKGWDVRASIIEIHELANTQYWKEELPRHSRIAVILPTSVSAQEAARFYETVCYNRGWNVRVCPDRQDAIDWLRGTTPPH